MHVRLALHFYSRPASITCPLLLPRVSGGIQQKGCWRHHRAGQLLVPCPILLVWAVQGKTHRVKSVDVCVYVRVCVEGVHALRKEAFTAVSNEVY